MYYTRVFCIIHIYLYFVLYTYLMQYGKALSVLDIIRIFICIVYYVSCIISQPIYICTLVYYVLYARII